MPTRKNASESTIRTYPGRRRRPTTLRRAKNEMAGVYVDVREGRVDPKTGNCLPGVCQGAGGGPDPSHAD
jgi:hypothetical protein